MKNLSIKKVALGVFLAGYAATSAYADFSPVNTHATIRGNAPTIYHPDGVRQRLLTVRITNDEAGTTALGNTVRAKVGNYIHIFYKLKDSDGDLDTDADHSVANSLTVFKKTARDTTWVPVTVNAQTRNTGEDGHIYFQITSEMAGAQIIGFRLQEVTPFGDPKANEWLQVSNIWNTTNLEPEHSSNVPPVPTVDNHGPGDADANNPTGPIESDATKLGIFKVDAATGSPIWNKNLAGDSVSAGTTDPALIPKYGDKLIAAVWTFSNASNPNNYPDMSIDTDQSLAYTFTWSLKGTADGVDANSTDKNVLNTTALGVSTDATNGWGVIQLATTNSYYSSLNGGAGYKAGIQGFKLQVEAR